MKRFLLLSSMVLAFLAFSAFKKKIVRDITIGPCKMHLVGTLQVNVSLDGISGTFTGTITFGPGCEGTIPGTVSFMYVKDSAGNVVITEIEGATIAVGTPEANALAQGISDDIGE
jgi:hypothetical protein